MTWGTSFVCYDVHNAVELPNLKLKPTHVLLDNQANVSLMKTNLLCDVRVEKSVVNIKGVGGKQLQVSQSGEFDGFFRVLASNETTANVLSFTQVEDLFEITYEPMVAFILHMPGGKKIRFERMGGLFVADFAEHYVFASVQENESIYALRTK